MKGIDLYKKVLEKDENILNKQFKGNVSLNAGGKYRTKEVVLYISDGFAHDSWGIVETDKFLNILSGKTPHEIDNIMACDWKEVKQPVDFMTAFEAWRNGKTIRWIDDEDVEPRYERLNDYVFLPTGDVTIHFMAYQIENGKWYIEN